MSTHTPGPWQWSYAAASDCYVITDPVAPNQTIAAVPNHDEASEPDARLIAAAPELLEAVRDALYSGDDWPREARTRAHALIRRIEGGE